VDIYPRNAGGELDMTGRVTIPQTDSYCSDNLVTFRLPRGYQAHETEIYLSITNSDGIWSNPHYVDISLPLPSVTSKGLGCNDNRCVWTKGSNFHSTCRANFYGFINGQFTSVGSGIQTVCYSDNYVTFRIPNSLYNPTVYSNNYLYYNIQNDFGNDVTNWTDLQYIIIKQEGQE
jgi:hypothetical protein